MNINWYDCHDVKVILVFHFLLFGVFFICRLVDVDFIVVYLLILIFFICILLFWQKRPSKSNYITGSRKKMNLITFLGAMAGRSGWAWFFRHLDAVRVVGGDGQKDHPSPGEAGLIFYPFSSSVWEIVLVYHPSFLLQSKVLLCFLSIFKSSEDH